MDSDLFNLLAAWIDGDVSEESHLILIERLRADSDFRFEVARELHLLGQLMVLRSAEPRWLRLEDELGWSSRKVSTPAHLADRVAAQIEGLPEPGRRNVKSKIEKLLSRRWVLAASMLLTTAAILAYFWMTPPSHFTQSPPPPDEAIAILARVTGPGFEGDSAPVEGAVIRTGTLTLKGGSASIAYFNGVTLQLEGPAVVELQTANRVFCRRGKFRIDAPPEGPGFYALAPGASVAEPTAEFAMTVEGEKADVMMIAGQAEVALLDSNGRIFCSETLTTGNAVHLDSKAGGIAKASRATADYANAIPSLDPVLVLDPQYASAIRLNRPTWYWRFETAIKDSIPNEIRTGPPLQLIGHPTIVGPLQGNHCLNFPPSSEFEQHGALTMKSWAPKGRDYALECWAMPRSVRHSALVGLVVEDDSTLLRQFGLLLELTGPSPTLLRHPARSVRALHRSSTAQNHAVNLFTPTTYLPYRWQHLVMQHSGTRMELYVNGELQAVAPALVEPAAPNLRLLLGALYARRDGTSVSERPFVGLIDEVAIYDHALSGADIAKHFQLASFERSKD